MDTAQAVSITEMQQEAAQFAQQEADRDAAVPAALQYVFACAAAVMTVASFARFSLVVDHYTLFAKIVQYANYNKIAHSFFGFYTNFTMNFHFCLLQEGRTFVFQALSNKKEVVNNA